MVRYAPCNSFGFSHTASSLPDKVEHPDKRLYVPDRRFMKAIGFFGGLWGNNVRGLDPTYYTDAAAYLEPNMAREGSGAFLLHNVTGQYQGGEVNPDGTIEPTPPDWIPRPWWNSLFPHQQDAFEQLLPGNEFQVYGSVAVNANHPTGPTHSASVSMYGVHMPDANDPADRILIQQSQDPWIELGCTGFMYDASSPVSMEQQQEIGLPLPTTIQIRDRLFSMIEYDRERGLRSTIEAFPNILDTPSTCVHGAVLATLEQDIMDFVPSACSTTFIDVFNNIDDVHVTPWFATPNQELRVWLSPYYEGYPDPITDINEAVALAMARGTELATRNFVFMTESPLLDAFCESLAL